MPSQLIFDPPGNHLLLFGERVIQAFAPPFLDNHFKVGHHLEALDQTLSLVDDEDSRVKLLDAYRRLPSDALVRAWEIGLSDKQRSLAWFRQRQRKEMHTWETAVDAGLSNDGQLLALLLRDSSGSSVSVRTGGFTPSDKYTGLQDEQFSIPNEWGEHQFCPERVFLFKDQNKGDSLALVSPEEEPMAAFYDVYGQKQEVVRLSMTTCHKICRQSKAPSLLLLDNDGVYFLSLLQRRIVKRVPYRADFSRLMNDVQGALKWYPGHEKHLQQQRHDCCISDDGYAVLLAWDVNNRKSIVVKPAMWQEECRRDIQASAKNLSSFCSLSPSGAFTAFLDMNALSQGCVTIGIFSESLQSVTSDVEVGRDLPKAVLADCLQKVLGNVFYGFDEVEKKLTVNTVRVSSASKTHSSIDTSLRPRIIPEQSDYASGTRTGSLKVVDLLKDRLDVFQIHQSASWRVNQDLLRFVKGTTDEALIERLRMSLGVSLFNLPLATNLTVFQAAAVNKRNEMKSRIIEMAKKQGVELALEWEVPVEQTSSTEKMSNRRLSVRRTRPGAASPVARPLPPAVKTRESTDLLKEALQTNRTNDIKEAVRLVCSDVAPFGSTARIMKKSFRELLKKERSIMAETLSEDSLLCEVCGLDVHVDFMNPRLRREDAVHINTTNSYLAWSEVSKQEVLNELWRSENKQEIRKMEKDGNTSTTKAKLMFVRIKDAAKAGMRGIIRPLLLARAPAHVFNTEVVKTVIQYKLCRIWKKRLLWSFLEYIVFVVVFSCYGVLVAASGNNSIGSSFEEIFNCGLAFVVYCFGGRMMWVEFRQALTFSREGREYFGSFVKGLAHYFFSKWNWLDILSSILLSMTIPALHFASLFDSELTEYFAMFVALESILVYAKIWYYVQPFRSIGSVAVMMNSIVRDSASCLMVACVYSVGFGLSLFILFSHVEKKDPEDADKSDDTCGSEEFQNFPKSLLTMFYAFLGSFEPDTYPTDGGWWSWMISLVFVTYLLVQSLLVLNIAVVAIMGDAYDKAKSSEEAVVLFRQAQHIDDLEAELTEENVKAIDSLIGKYVCKLVYPDGKDHDEEEGSGRMNMIETCVQKSLQDWGEMMEIKFQNFQWNIESVEVKCRRIYEPIEELLKKVERMEARSCVNAERTEEMRREIAAQSTANARRIEEMLRENTERMERIVALFHDRRLDHDVQP